MQNRNLADDFDNSDDFVAEESNGKRDRFGYDYVSARKNQDRSLSLSRDTRVGRVSKAHKRSSKRGERQTAILKAWKDVR